MVYPKDGHESRVGHLWAHAGQATSHPVPQTRAKGGKVRSEASKQRSRNAQTETYAENKTKTHKQTNHQTYKNFNFQISHM